MDATCSPPPEGASRWTLKLLGDHLVGLGLVDSLSNPTIGRALKNGLKQWQVEQWCLPPQGSAAFVCTMEDVLKTYNRPCDEKRPLVCFDEMCMCILMYWFQGSRV